VKVEGARLKSALSRPKRSSGGTLGDEKYGANIQLKIIAERSKKTRQSLMSAGGGAAKETLVSPSFEGIDSDCRKSESETEHNLRTNVIVTEKGASMDAVFAR